MVKEGDNSFGIASVCLGVVGLVLSLNNQLAGIILGIVAIVLSKKQAKNVWAKWGRNLGIISIIVSIILIIVAIIVIYSNPQIMEQLKQLESLQK